MKRYVLSSERLEQGRGDVGIVSMREKGKDSVFVVSGIFLARKTLEDVFGFPDSVGLHRHLKAHGLLLIVADEERAAISLGRMNFDYEETDTDGTFLDGEYGNIPGFTIDYSRKLQNKTLAKFSLEYYWGTVDYDGHLQSLTDPNVDMFPFKTRTEEKVLTLTAYLSSKLNKSENPLSIYGSFSYKNWERDKKNNFFRYNLIIYDN